MCSFLVDLINVYARERVVHHFKHFGMYRSNLIGNFTHGGANGLLLLLISIQSSLKLGYCWWDEENIEAMELFCLMLWPRCMYLL